MVVAFAPVALYFMELNYTGTRSCGGGIRFMRSKAAEYRQNAAECLRIAEHISDQVARRELLVMAQAWHKLAFQADRNSKVDLVYETPAREQEQGAQQQQQIQPPDD